MTIEQRLTETLEAAKAYDVSPDLWDRVVHSIEEDRLHRRRVRAVIIGIALSLVVAIVIAGLNIESGLLPNLSRGRRIDWRVLEGLELVVMATLVVLLAPAIRRFGRGYVSDIFYASTPTGPNLLRLLDIAYYLLFAGYVLITTRLGEPVAHSLFDMADQMEDVLFRIGGLLMVMGLLHAATLMAIPLVGLVFNTTRSGTKLPKWVTVILVIVAIQLALNLPILPAILGGG